MEKNKTFPTYQSFRLLKDAGTSNVLFTKYIAEFFFLLNKNYAKFWQITIKDFSLFNFVLRNIVKIIIDAIIKFQLFICIMCVINIRQSCQLRFNSHVKLSMTFFFILYFTNTFRVFMINLCHSIANGNTSDHNGIYKEH